MYPAKLRDRHFPFFEFCGFELLAQIAHHQIAIELFLLGKPGRVDGFKLLQEYTGLSQIFIDRRLGKIT